jgi:hypothetical protein
MRHCFPRTMSAVWVLFVCVLSASFLGQSQPPHGIPKFQVMSHPREGRLRRGHAFDGDLRTLPQVQPHSGLNSKVVQPIDSPTDHKS